MPGALPEALRKLAERAPPETLDRLWIFPPLARGRSERGVIAASCFAEGERRLLLTLAYRAEESGKGISFSPLIQEEGEAPEGTLPRVIEGVVRRSEDALGAPRSVAIEGDPETFRLLLEEVGAAAESGAGVRRP